MLRQHSQTTEIKDNEEKSIIALHFFSEIKQGKKSTEISKHEEKQLPP